MKSDTRNNISISVILTSHNEGRELSRTLRSIQENTCSLKEIIIVDDASTDSSCCLKTTSVLSVIKHRRRYGVAYSRNKASRLAKGNVFAYLDAHQRLEPGCLDQCASLAIEREAIVCPDIRGYETKSRTLYGAVFTKKKNLPPFGAAWKIDLPKKRVTTVNALRAPAYVIPASVYPQVRWSQQMRGWGGSEGLVSLKAFFSGTKILHLNGTIAHHRFKKKFHYDVGWKEVWRNQALIARICFSEETWHNYWLPEVFAPNLDHKTLKELESSVVQSDHLRFQAIKVRPDYEFWTHLIRRRIPRLIKSQCAN